MPRIVTIISPEVPETPMFVGATLARTPKFTLSPTPDNSILGIVPHDMPSRPAIETPHPFFVVDPLEVEWIVGVQPPSAWEPAILTHCYVPYGADYDMWIDVALDVAGMCGGFAVLKGEVIPFPEPWHWSRGEDGRWQADSDWMDANVAAYHERTGGTRNSASTGDLNR